MRWALIAIAAALWAGSAAADGMVGNWSVTEKTAALTGRPMVSAQVSSDEELVNQIRQPERATLNLRCQDGALAFYVAWPRVMSHDANSILLNMPQTLARYRVDDGPIKTDFWILSDDQTAAGSFDNIGAPKLFKAILGAHRLVVRLGDDSSQDATFQLDGVSDVEDRIVQACLGTPRGPIGSPAEAPPTIPKGPSQSAPATFAPASADSYREPKTGAPAFVIDAPPGWWIKYSDAGDLQLMASDHSTMLQLSVMTDPKAAAAPLSEVAASVFRGAGAQPYTRTEPASLAGLPGQAFISVWQKQPSGFDMKLVLVKLDPTHVAMLGTYARPSLTPDQSAALTNLIARVRIVR